MVLSLLRTRVPGKLGAVISPLVRRMAREHGVDLGDLHGSGESGLIMRRDVEAAITSPDVEASPDVEPGPAAEPKRLVSETEREADSRTGLSVSSRRPVKGVRKVVAAT